MKIFKYDFDKGKRGDHIDTFTHFGNGERIGFCKKSGMAVYEHVYDANDYEVTADDYIEDAICCCVGKDDNEWKWIIIPNTELTKKAKIRNKKIFGTTFFPKEG